MQLFQVGIFFPTPKKIRTLIHLKSIVMESQGISVSA